jgi:hypothetical protein
MVTVVSHRGLKAHNQQQGKKDKRKHNHQVKKMLLELQQRVLKHLVHRQLLIINL